MNHSIGRGQSSYAAALICAVAALSACSRGDKTPPPAEVSPLVGAYVSEARGNCALTLTLLQPERAVIVTECSGGRGDWTMGTWQASGPELHVSYEGHSDDLRFEDDLHGRAPSAKPGASGLVLENSSGAKSRLAAYGTLFYREKNGSEPKTGRAP